VKDEVNMRDTKQIARPTPYATCDDFRRLFNEDMNTLYQLASLLTADNEKAVQCFVSGLDDVVKGNPVFKEWARSWARRAVILNAVRVIDPRPTGGNDPDRSRPYPVDSNVKALSDGDGQQIETAAVLDLKSFERFVYVLTVLERYSDQECSVLLGCMRRDVVAARTRAFQQIASAMGAHGQRTPSISEEKSAVREGSGSALQLLVTPRLATSS
jgi:DNA-directed RNA polymerase specialized sigma24 family protein